MNLVTPWNIDKIKRAEDLQAIALVKEHLYKRGFNVEKWKDASPQLQGASEGILTALFGQEQVNLIVMCNSFPLLTSLSHVLPVIFALTKRVASCLVNTTGLLELFMSRTPTDIWESYPAGEILSSIENSGLITWMAPNLRIAGAEKMEGKFSKIISSRHDQKKMILLVKTVSKGSAEKKHIEETTKQLSEAFGVMIGSIIVENANFFGLNVKLLVSSFNSLEV